LAVGLPWIDAGTALAWGLVDDVVAGRADGTVDGKAG